ncbi:hypothetical protein DFH09DRAFT_1079837 [Mycena vulgaris]|nr:hypothetical protein DFH09DRAFT_1079837 [Mycena vulgaris]
MPLEPTIPQIRFNNVLTALSAAVATLKVVSISLKAPFLEPISNTMQSLLTAVQPCQTIKIKDEFIQMLEQIHQLLYAIIHIHIISDGGELSPNMLDHLGRFTETLHKIHTFLEAQQEKSRIKQFFRQGEMNMLLKGCRLGLEQALAEFKVQDFHLSSDLTHMQECARKTHQEVLELISSFSDGASSERTLSLSRFSINQQGDFYSSKQVCILLKAGV